MARKRDVTDLEVLNYAKDFLKRNEEKMVTIREYSEIVKVKKSTLNYCFIRYLKEIDLSLYNNYLCVAKRNMHCGGVKGGENHFKYRNLDSNKNGGK